MSCSLRDNLLVTMGARAAYMDMLREIDIPDGCAGEDVLASFVGQTVDDYLAESDKFVNCESFDEYIETALLKAFAPLKQYHVKVTRVYDFFVEARGEADAILEAETCYAEHTNDVADDCRVEILDVYASPGTE